LFFRIEKNHPGIVFLLETMQVGIKFTISFLKKNKKKQPLYRASHKPG
jgi:hypothetical protein